MNKSDATFDVVSETRDPECVIEVRGDFNLQTLAGLGRALRDAIAERPTMLIVDLAEVGSLDRSGLAVLAAARRRGLDVGVRLLLQAPSEAIVELLATSGMNRRLPVVPVPGRTDHPRQPRR